VQNVRREPCCFPGNESRFESAVIGYLQEFLLKWSGVFLLWVVTEEFLIPFKRQKRCILDMLRMVKYDAASLFMP
jgi:hypothetical protein